MNGWVRDGEMDGWVVGSVGKGWHLCSLLIEIRIEHSCTQGERGFYSQEYQDNEMRG